MSNERIDQIMFGIVVFLGLLLAVVGLLFSNPHLSPDKQIDRTNDVSAPLTASQETQP